MEKHSHLPAAEQLSLVTGVILVAYIVSNYLVIPFNPIPLQLPGIYIPVSLQFRNLVFITVAVLAAAGVDWIISGHPEYQPGGRLQHWLLPSLTAWVIGIPLYTLPPGLAWWGVFTLGGILFVMVIISEYITVDPDDNRNRLAGIGLSALSLVLFLVLAVSIRASGVRLYIMAPTTGLAAVLVSMRIFYLRTGYNWRYSWSIGTGLIMVQLAASLHYLSLTPIQFGLVLVGLLNGLITVGEENIRGSFTVKGLIEPAVIILAAILLAVVLN